RPGRRTGRTSRASSRKPLQAGSLRRRGELAEQNWQGPLERVRSGRSGSPMQIVFLLVGLVFVAFGVAVVLAEARARQGAWAVPGEVIGFSTGQSGASGASF